MRRLLNHMKHYADDGPKYLSGAKFRLNEGRHSYGKGFSGGALVQAFADNSGGIRVYGCSEMVRGRRLFICTEMDANKKRRKADPAKLRRAAQVLVLLSQKGESESRGVLGSGLR